jgi:hypothetical protein
VKTSLQILAGALVFAGCNKAQPDAPSALDVRPGRVVVNEMVSSGSTQRNEFEEYADWVELYNPGPSIELEAGSWFVTDDADQEPLKFELPAITLEGGGFLVLWCDGQNGVADGIHTSFSLSAKDRSFALVHVGNDGPQEIDRVEIIDHKAPDMAFGRDRDGSAHWVQLDHPTPSAPNEAPPDQH